MGKAVSSGSGVSVRTDRRRGERVAATLEFTVRGENETFQGPEDYLRSRGVKVELADNAECKKLMREFIAANPALWNEDIGET